MKTSYKFAATSYTQTFESGRLTTDESWALNGLALRHEESWTNQINANN